MSANYGQYPDQPQYGYRRGRGQQRPPTQQPQLFDDTSTDMSASYGQYPDQQQYGYPPAQGSYAPPVEQTPVQQYAGQNYINDPMANVAMQWGQNAADQGKEYLNKHIEQYVSPSKLKYYFAVDTSYVGKKLGLLVFPYAHKDWSIKFNQNEPIAPRYEVNAPDLYIPVMAIVTYILLAGVVLGTQNSFSPEKLGVTASTAMVWLVIEIVVLLISMYILRVSTDLKYYDLLAYCGYKYVGMILCLLGKLLFQSQGYYIVLLWTSFSTAFFLVRSLKMAIIPHNDTSDYAHGNKRRLYMLLVIALTQPIFMWFLTYSL